MTPVPVNTSTSDRKVKERVGAKALKFLARDNEARLLEVRPNLNCKGKEYMSRWRDKFPAKVNSKGLSGGL